MLSNENIIKLAQAIHADYYRNYPNMDYSVDWNELPDNIQQVNIDQAMNFERYAQLIDCEIAADGNGREAIAGFTNEQLFVIAKNIHEIWVKSKVDFGWTYAPVRANDKKHHPMLVAWDKLSPEEQEKDYAVARGIVPLLVSVGLMVYKKINEE